MRKRNGLIGCFGVCVVTGFLICAVFIWIDISRISYESWHLQASLDAAVLAGAQHLPEDKRSATEVAQRIFNLNESNPMPDSRSIRIELCVTGKDDSVLMGKATKPVNALATFVFGKRDNLIYASAKAGPISCVDTPYPHVLPPEIAIPGLDIGNCQSFKSTVLVD